MGVRVFAFFALFSLSIPFYSEACQPAIEELQRALAKASFHLRSEASVINSPRIEGRPLHLSSHISLPFLWITNTASGTDYSVVEKSKAGFGFSAAPISQFEFLRSDSFYLRSLDMNGRQNRLLATLLYRDPESGEEQVSLIAANVKDAESGQLAPQGDPIVLEGVLKPRENLVVSARPGTNEFWLTDESRLIRVVQLADEGPLHVSTIEIPETTVVNGVDLKIDSVLKIEFFADTQSGYIKFKTQDGQILLARISFQIVQEPGLVRELQGVAGSAHGIDFGEFEAPQLVIDFEDSIPLRSDQNRSSIHPNEPLVFVTYKNQIEVYRMSDVPEKVTTLDVSHLLEGYELNGIEFYWEGEFRKAQGAPDVEARFFGEVKAVLFLWDDNKKETRFSWISIGNTRK